MEEIIQQQEHSEEDNMATGSISMATIKRYFVGGMGWFMALLVPVIFILGQVCKNIFFRTSFDKEKRDKWY